MSAIVFSLDDQTAAIGYITRHLKYGRPTPEMVDELAMVFAEARARETEAAALPETMPADQELNQHGAMFKRELDRAFENRDPWKHRGAIMRCRTCMFFVEKVATGPHPPKFVPLGRCRRHAPTMSGYPAVFQDDWCGDHKLDETKI